MQKKILSLALALILVLALVPGIATPALAASTLSPTDLYAPVFKQYAAEMHNYIYFKYAFCDIDSNGVAELIVEYSPGSEDCSMIYSYANNSVHLIGQFWSRNRLDYISEQGLLYNGGSSGAGDSTYTIWRISDDKTSLVSVEHWAHYYGEYTHTSQGVTRKITYNEFESAMPLFSGPDRGILDTLNWQTTLPAANKPDTWAEAEVSAALDLGLVPDSIANGGWQNATSRLAAADAIVAIIEKASGKTMAQLASEKGWDLTSGGFDDTNSQAVTFLKHAGVTTGVGDNKYAPDSDYNRAQIVTMIGRSAEVFFGATAQGTNPFTDVPDWAAPYVAYAADNDITQGVGGGLFDSEGTLQNQHTAVFGYRAYSAWK